MGAGTAFWVLLFGVPWYVKCQSALNQYWTATATPAPAATLADAAPAVNV